MGVFVMLFLTLVAGSCAQLDSRIRIVKQPVRDQYIVVFNKTSNVNKNVERIQGIIGRQNVRSVFKKVLKGVSVRVKDPKKLTKILDLVAIVDYVEQDGIVNVSRPINFEPNSFALAWGLDRINQRYLPLDQSASFTGNGSGASVYVIDTGIYSDHEFFGGRASFGYDATDEEEASDCDGHGTHCAGTVGADYYGIARGANLFGVRVIDCRGSGSISWVLGGMDWVVENHVAPAVASMSLRTWKTEALNEAVRGMHDAGITVVAGAGNENMDACEFSPASAPEAITVGATDISDHRASFSNYGACVDIFAPGVNILSTFIDYPKSTETFSGTSMACPHVSGIAALILGNNPKLTPDEVWKKMSDDATTHVLQETGELSPDKLLYAAP